jgi:hypothetical protein
LGEKDSSTPIPPPPEAPQQPPANNWIPIGPSVLRQGQGAVKPATNGRTVGIAVAPNGTRVYIAAANGGVWYSEDTGQTWRSLMEAFDLNPTHLASDSLACGAIAIIPGASANQDRIYVGTGEGQGGAYFGVGPILSTDGGQNWNPPEPVSPGSPELAGSAFYALAVDPADIDRVVAATRQGIYRREPDGSGGFHWTQKNLPGAGSTWATSVVVASSGGTTTFYAATWFGPVFSSTDGHIWTQVGTGFPSVNVGRIGLAVQADNPDVVYALIHNSSNGAILGVWRLDTSDNIWRQVSGHPTDLFGTPPHTQGSYDLAIAVDPNNVNRIYLGGSTKWSGGGGGDWSGSLYRCIASSSGSGINLTYSMTNTYIGASVHADIHTIVFTPGDSNKLWVGCDGGVFYSTNPTGTGNIFKSCNTGLATLTMNYLGQHPTEDAVLFCGTQDNGGVRFTGEEVWLYSSGGDGGDAVINWNDPYKVLSTYVYGSIRRSTDGGSRYSYSSVNVPLTNSDSVLFYAPLEGTPRNTANPSEADRVAFGSNRVWISDTFGGNWTSIPNGNTGDILGTGNLFRIKSLAFASYNKLYAGTMNGRVYRFDQSGTTWTRTRIDTIGGANALPLAGIITAIAIDHADPTGNSIYITFGGSGDWRHVWHFDGAQWQQRSGPSAGHSKSLLDIQYNAIVVDPLNNSHIYTGADIGIWQSTDGGVNWEPFSQGLPDAAVLDLKLHANRRILRASTHGRGVYERTLDSGPKMGVELYVRDTQLDQGRFTTINFLPDPTDKGSFVAHWFGPDIKVDTPDINGNYQFPLTGTIDFLQFVDKLTDDAKNVATHATATITTRVYVQVHNRGVIPADNVRVMLLLANASAGLPALPVGYTTNVQNGTPINTPDWKTIGIATLNDVRVGFPKIAAFDLTSNKLPPPANLAGNQHHCVLALVHHIDDPYTSTETNTDVNSMQERKAAHKNLHVVQFTGTLPSPPPVIIPVRIHNANLEKKSLSSFIVNLHGYPGRVRLCIPPMKTDGNLEELIDGLVREQGVDDFRRWAESHIQMITKNQKNKHHYNNQWAKQRIEDVHSIIESGTILGVKKKDRVSINNIVMAPKSYYTLFLMFNRPEDGKIGETYNMEIQQWNQELNTLNGGLALRVELVPEPEIKYRYHLKLWSHNWLWFFKVIRARLYDYEGRQLTPNKGAEVRLELRIGEKPVKDLGPMRYHWGWRSFYRFIRIEKPSQAEATTTALLNGKIVGKAKIIGL